MMKNLLPIFYLSFLFHVFGFGADQGHAKNQPKYSFEIRPLDLVDSDANDINKVAIAPLGKFLMRSDLGGDCKQYNLYSSKGTPSTNGDYVRKSSQYFIMPTYSKTGNYLFLNSAIKSNRFSDMANVEVFLINENRRVASLDTQLLNYNYSERPSIFDISPDEKYLAYCKDGYNVMLYDLAANKETQLLTTHPQRITALAFHPSPQRGLLAVKWGCPGHIGLFDIHTQKKLADYAGNHEDIGDVRWEGEKSLFFDGQGEHVITTSDSSSKFYLWKTTGQLVGEGAWLLNQVAVAETRKFVVIGNQVFNTVTTKFLTLPGPRRSALISLALAPREDLLLVGFLGHFSVYETTNFTEVGQFILPDESGGNLSKIVFIDQESFYVIHGDRSLWYVHIATE